MLGRWVQVYQELDEHSRVCPPSGTTLLHMAAAANLVDLIEPVVSDVKDVAIRNMYGDTALHLAARWGHVTAGKILRGKGADQDAKNESGKTPLFEAASNGNLEFVEWLLDEGVDLGKKGDRGALQAASLGGYESVVEILLGAGADVNAQGGRYGLPLLAAIHEGYVDQVQILLHAGADSLLADELGRTPLHIAASKNKLHILRRFPQLLSALNKRSDFLQTPLHLAVCLGHIEFAIGLLNSGADPSLPDGYGKHVMDWASGHEALLQEIHNHCPYLVFTPPDTQELSVHRSLYELIESHPYSKSKSSWPILQQLGRFFLFLGQFDNARYLFQLHLRQDASSKTDIWQISCNMCNQIITGTRFICRLCACIDICSSCV